MILCITEKPSVGTDIARILGANSRHDGYFEGNGYCVTWTFGHLCTLKEPDDYTPLWKSWRLAYLPMIPNRFGIKIIPQKNVEHQFKVIESLIGQASEIINCGDAGQEGELIQRWVMQKAGCKIPVKRLWISSLTDDAIIEGFRHLKPQEDLQPLYEAGLCRAIGDWVLGINATRLYTLKYRAQSVDRNDERPILSVGRVQTPTLALIVKRQLEIENFVPKDSWEVKTLYRGTIFSSSLKPFESPEKAQKVIDEISPLPFQISDVTKKKGSEAPPKLFDLTSLQVEANKKYGYSADDTLKTIQSLYEMKLTTYPRVDTTYLTDDLYPKCGQILMGLSRFQSVIEPLKGKPLKKTKKVFDNSKVTDHHAIIPTGQPVPENLTQRELNVFNLIALRFIAVFWPDCVFEQTTALATVGKYKFKASGKVIINPGWKTVYAKDTQDDHDEEDKADDNETSSSARGAKEENKEMPEFKKGESGSHQPRSVKRTSQPPKYYTEGTLLKAMETAGSQVENEDLREALKANGIGRPSTRASIIEILYKRDYIVKVKKSIRATQAGIDLINVIKDDLLKSPELTGIWENKLRRIERREYPASEFISQIKNMIQQITITVLNDNSQVKI
ncbi:MAG: DNA topoisomerase 3 [Muribaculaceae bacterium]|nr:DNA topoisomerase 3 [Muribaculaceae bacterium]